MHTFKMKHLYLKQQNMTQAMPRSQVRIPGQVRTGEKKVTLEKVLAKGIEQNKIKKYNQLLQ